MGGIFTTDAELRVRSWNQWLGSATGISAADGYTFLGESRRMSPDHVDKPFVPEHLISTIARAIETSV